VIHDINMRRMFSGAEMAGIKFHGAVDSLIAHNHIYRCDGFGGIWLDWMTQGTRVTGNLLHDNTNASKHSQDLFVEVNHGPFLIDNNIFLSKKTLLDQSTGAAYVHNLFGGSIPKVVPQSRETPYLKAHSTEIAGLSDTPGGDNRFINNLFLGGYDLSPYEGFENMTIKDNRFLDTAANLLMENGDVLLEFGPGLNSSDGVKRQLVKSGDLGKTIISGLPFETAEGAPLVIDHDYFGQLRQSDNPHAGSFARTPDSAINLKVWPKR